MNLGGKEGLESTRAFNQEYPCSLIGGTGMEPKAWGHCCLKLGNFQLHVSISITLKKYMQIINNEYIIYIVLTAIYRWKWWNEI